MAEGELQGLRREEHRGRCEEFLDLELKEEDPLLKQKELIQGALDKAAPEKVQEMLRILSICNTQIRE